ncbi:unnamed protein product, partial [Sphagnum compactum]
YLEENVDKTYVDVGVMAKELQVRYPEYGRRKTVPFRLLVEQAYKTVLHSYGLDSNPSSEGEDDDLEVMDNSVQPGRSNQMSEMLKNLYSNKSGNKLPTNEGDPIDISSDDSEDESSPPPMPRQRSLTPKPVEVPKLSNVVITIQKRPVDTETPIENGLAKKRKVDEPPTLRNVTPVPITATAPVQPQASVSSKSKKYKKEIAPKTSTVTFNDMGGMVKTLKQLCELLMHLKHPEIYEHFGLPPPRGFLLHGPPGSGKTLLARAIAGQLNIPLLEVAATELIAGVTGESEERIRDVFEQAAALAPCVLFMDEIDAISSNRLNAQKDMERRIVAQLLNSLDGLSTKVGGNQVLVIGATNRPDSLDPALRRVGRFDQEILLGIPDRLARKEILQILCKNVKLEEGFDYDKLAVLTPGYVGADLLALAARAVSTAVKRIFRDKKQELCKKQSEMQAKVTESKIIKEVKQQVINDENLTLDDLLTWLKNGTPPITRSELIGFCTTMQDFVHALKLVQPSAKREGFITVPDVTWDDIGSLADIREELKLAILAPVKYPKQWETLGLSAPSGVLLCGPPGCGKTLLAKAVANEAGINFISVKGPELLNMYVGESERAVRQCFQRARNSAPCVIFFDEFDALCPKRSESSENSAGMRVVNQLLTEMDGVEERKGIFLMAATNRPDIIDPAVLRPGRFDKILYVGLPNEQDRVDILLALTKYGVKPPLDEDVNLKEVAQITEGFTGADLAGLMRQSALQALKSSMYDLETEDNIIMDVKVNKSHIFDALSTIKPSVSKDDKLHYDKFRQKYGKHTQTNIQM